MANYQPNHSKTDEITRLSTNLSKIRPNYAEIEENRVKNMKSADIINKMIKECEKNNQPGQTDKTFWVIDGFVLKVLSGRLVMSTSVLYNGWEIGYSSIIPNPEMVLFLVALAYQTVGGKAKLHRNDKYPILTRQKAHIWLSHYFEIKGE